MNPLTATVREDAISGVGIRKRGASYQPYRHRVAASGLMHYLPRAARQAREEAGRKQVHVAASIDVDQSVITRFERGQSSPRDIDRVVAAYADDLDIEPLEIWQRAIEMWSQREAVAAIDRAADDLGAKPRDDAERPERRQGRAG